MVGKVDPDVRQLPLRVRGITESAHTAAAITGGAQVKRMRFGLAVTMAVSLTSMLSLGGQAGAINAPAGQTVREPAYRFVVTLPPGWKQIPLSSADLKAMFAQLGKTDPALESSIAGWIQPVLAQHVIKLYALDLLSLSTSTDNLNVGVAPDAIPPDLLDLTAKEAVSVLDGRDVSITAVVVAKVPAVRATYVADVDSAAGRLTLRGTQYYFSHFNQTYVVTVTTSGPSPNLGLATKIVSTFHWLPPAA
jgi:hypothetical protein